MKAPTGEAGKFAHQRKWNLLEALRGNTHVRVILITGCSPGGGLGPETAKALRLTGADIYITNRNINTGQQVAEENLPHSKKIGTEEAIEINLSSLKSIRAGAEEFLKKSGNKLNILINNAGKYLVRMEIYFVHC